jgi:two-component system, OmpR family, response regulator
MTVPLRPVRILVIEDDPRIASVLGRGLELHGWQVELAEDGSTGRDAWTNGDFDLVVMDVTLPGINGIDLCAQRRAEGDRTPVMLLTARDDDADRWQGDRAGANAYVTKPFVYRDLMAAVEQLLGS